MATPALARGLVLGRSTLYEAPGVMRAGFTATGYSRTPSR